MVGAWGKASLPAAFKLSIDGLRPSLTASSSFEATFVLVLTSDGGMLAHNSSSMLRSRRAVLGSSVTISPSPQISNNPHDNSRMLSLLLNMLIGSLKNPSLRYAG